MKRKIEVVVNKNWETEPVLSALTNPKLRSKELPFPVVINTPKRGDCRMSEYRAVFHLEYVDVFVRCIEDLMASDVSSSSSEEKYRVLPRYIECDSPDLVISVSTAESTPDIQQGATSLNGSVYIGGTFYMFDARNYDPTTTSHIDIIIDLLKNNVSPQIYHLVDDDFRKKVLTKFIPAQNAPANPLTCTANLDFVAIGAINVTDYKTYGQADPAAYHAFKKQYPQTGTAATIETTHGIVKMAAKNIPTLFVSPITDSYEHFAGEATDTQNYIVSFNAGITVGELICSLNKYFGKNRLSQTKKVRRDTSEQKIGVN
ncbi:MAG: hypothetical protein FWH37_08115 [Candidatus Bathyarchaeota archaeon]|nr:hypothetical protein [Candidatus Termiticorpusculum sp.]